MKISVVEGDILHCEADAMIMAVNTNGQWQGRMDSTAMAAVASFYADGLKQHMPLSDSDVVVVKNPPNFAPAFRQIIFVVDGLVRPLSALVGLALTEADNRQFAKVVLPLFRTGMNAAKLPREDAPDEMIRAIRNLERRGPRFVQEVQLTIFRDYPSANKLRNLLAVT